MRRSFLSLAVIAALLAAPAVRAEIIISEIMYNPAGDDAGREWVEIYNSGASAVNLEGWQIGDSQDNQWASPFPSGTILGPSQALVVTGDSAAFLSQWRSNHIQVADFPTLANDPSPTNELVVLRDNLGLPQDTVNYDDAGHWNRVTGSQGQSIFALPTGLSGRSNDFGANWKPSTWGAYGTRFSNAGGENHASPGYVETVAQDAFAPSPDAAWSMAILPDTQNYAKASADKHIFTQQTEWIRDNREAFKIEAVLHEGDIVNNNDTRVPTGGGTDQTSTQQWQNAQASMHVLNGHVPYIMAAGNHDYGTTNAQNRQTFFNDYFKATDNPLVDPAQGGILKGVKDPGKLDNAYYEFTAPDGREMLIVALEWEPQTATVTWANQIASLPEYEDHTAILLTHAYLQGSNNRYTSSKVPADHSGQELWNGLVRHHENFEMTFNGHFGGDGSGYLKSNGVNGNTVHQMFFNTQFETHGGDGWLRVVEFLEDGKTVRVRTFSPLLDMVRDHPQWEFEFEISPIDVIAPILAGDYNDDGIVDASDYTLWRDTFGSTELLAADGNKDGTVNAADYDVWKQNFGATKTSDAQAVAAVPEPATLVVTLVAVGVLAGAFRRRAR